MWAFPHLNVTNWQEAPHRCVPALHIYYPRAARFQPPALPQRRTRPAAFTHAGLCVSQRKLRKASAAEGRTRGRDPGRREQKKTTWHIPHIHFTPVKCDSCEARCPPTDAGWSQRHICCYNQLFTRGRRGEESGSCLCVSPPLRRNILRHWTLAGPPAFPPTTTTILLHLDGRERMHSQTMSGETVEWCSSHINGWMQFSAFSRHLKHTQPGPGDADMLHRLLLWNCLCANMGSWRWPLRLYENCSRKRSDKKKISASEHKNAWASTRPPWGYDRHDLKIVSVHTHFERNEYCCRLITPFPGSTVSPAQQNHLLHPTTTIKPRTIVPGQTSPKLWHKFTRSSKLLTTPWANWTSFPFHSQ